MLHPCFIQYLFITRMGAGGKSLAFDSSCVPQSFFAACISIYAHAKNLEEVVHLKLQESYCLPILSYAAAAVKYTTRQLDELMELCLHMHLWL